MTYTSNLEIDNIDVTSDSSVVYDTVTLDNQNGDVDVSVNFTVTKTDVMDSCYEYEDDVNVTVYPLDFSMNHTQQQDVTVEYQVKQWSCPQQVKVELGIEAIPRE